MPRIVRYSLEGLPANAADVTTPPCVTLKASLGRQTLRAFARVTYRAKHRSLADRAVRRRSSGAQRSNRHANRRYFRVGAELPVERGTGKGDIEGASGRCGQPLATMSWSSTASLPSRY